MSNLTGKTAVVTGASKGIGASIAEHLAAAGASVVVNYATSKTGADAVVERITSKGGKAIAVAGRCLRSLPILRSCLQETEEGLRKTRHPGKQCRHLRVLTSGRDHTGALPQAVRLECAGLAADDAGSCEADWGGRWLDHQRELDCWTDAGANGFGLQRNEGRGGCGYRFVSGRVGTEEDPCQLDQPRHGGDRGAALGGFFAESDFRKHTEATDALLGRIAQPQDIATAAVFFASDDAGWVTGQTLVLAGGARQ